MHELGFERTGDVKKGLGLGKRERIHQWFSVWAPDAEHEIKDDLSVHVKGSLDLQYYQVTHLPEGLSVEGNLYLQNTQVTQLPEDLSVERSLYLWNTQVTRLSEGLSVGGDLWLKGSQVTRLPEDLNVGRYIYMGKDQDIEVSGKLSDKIRYR
jgi:hypothetical protein